MSRPLQTAFMLCMLLVIALVRPGSAAADPFEARGVALANACAACHGPHGRSQGAIPAIDTLPPEDVMAALQAFRTGGRTGTVMNRIAKGLDAADVSALGRYFSNLQKR